MLNIFRGLKPFQLSEFVLLATFAFIIPISWKIATYVMIALFINTFLKGVFEEGFKRNKLQYKNKLTYFIFIAYWLIFAISFLYSENSDEARFQIGKKLSFFLFPIFFLYSNLEYLNINRIRTIMYSFTLGILTLFFVNLIWAGWDFIFNNAEIKRLIHHGFFFKTFNYDILGIIHHTYFSISTCTALAFCLVELFKVNEKKLVIYNIISIIIFIFIPFFVESRLVWQA